MGLRGTRGSWSSSNWTWGPASGSWSSSRRRNPDLRCAICLVLVPPPSSVSVGASESDWLQITKETNLHIQDIVVFVWIWCFCLFGCLFVFYLPPPERMTWLTSYTLSSYNLLYLVLRGESRQNNSFFVFAWVCIFPGCHPAFAPRLLVRLQQIASSRRYNTAAWSNPRPVFL